VSHGLARLRIDIRVVEAGLARAELDDHDLEPTTEHLWVPDGDVPVACLRLLMPPGAPPTIDRACARADVRRLGLTSALVTDVLARFGADWVNALARPPLVPFFLKHGFELHPDAQDARDGDGCLVLIRHPEAPWRG
jgi:ElaA protein